MAFLLTGLAARPLVFVVASIRTRNHLAAYATGLRAYPDFLILCLHFMELHWSVPFTAAMSSRICLNCVAWLS